MCDPWSLGDFWCVALRWVIFYELYHLNSYFIFGALKSHSKTKSTKGYEHWMCMKKKTDTIQSREPFIPNVCTQREYFFFSLTNQIDLGNFSKWFHFYCFSFITKPKILFEWKSKPEEGKRTISLYDCERKSHCSFGQDRIFCVIAFDHLWNIKMMISSSASLIFLRRIK